MSATQVRTSFDRRSLDYGQQQHAGRSRQRVRLRATSLRRRRNSPLRLPVVPGDPELEDSALASQEFFDEHFAPLSYDDVLSSEDPTLSDCWRTSWDDEQADTDTGRSFRTSTGNQALSGNGAGPLHSSSEHDGADPPASTAQPQDAGRSILKQQQQLQQQASTFTRSLARLASNLVPPWVKSKFTPKLRGLVLLNLLVVLVATNWVVVKESGGINGLDFAALRFSIAALAFLPFLPGALAKDPETGERVILKAGLELSVWTALGYFTQTLGLMTTDASRASFLSTFTVLAVPLLAGSSFGDSRGIPLVTWLSALAAIAGVGLLEQSGAAPGIGDLWSLLSAAFFGVQVFRTEVLSRRLPSKSTFKIMAASLAGVAVLMSGAAGLAHPGEVADLVHSPAAALQWMATAAFPWGQILYTGLLSTDLALLIELVALKDVSSTECALVYSLEPVLGAGFAFLALGERWGPTGWLGAAIIVASSLTGQIWGGQSDDSAAKSIDDGQ